MLVLLIKNIKNIAVATLVVGLLVGITPQATQAHPHDTGEWVQITKHPQSYEWSNFREASNNLGTYIEIKLIEYSHYYLSTVVPDMRDSNGRYAGDGRCGQTYRETGEYRIDYGGNRVPVRILMYAHHLVEFKLNKVAYEVCIPVGTVWEGWVTDGMARDTRKPHPYRTDEPIANDPKSKIALTGIDLNIPTQMFVMDKDYNGLTYAQSNNGYVAVSELPGACIYIAYAGNSNYTHIPSFTHDCNDD